MKQIRQNLGNGALDTSDVPVPPSARSRCWCGPAQRSIRERRVVTMATTFPFALD